ncbi:hypothetical protein MRX96_034291 [Rhipicephalus microplus]
MAAAKANFAALAKLVADVLVSDEDDGEMSDLQSEEEQGETSDLAVSAVLVAQIIKEDRHRVRLYVESVVDSYSDEEFRRLFRLQRCTTEVITADFESSSYYPRGGHGRPKITASKTMLIALTYLGTQWSMNAIADKFGVSESTDARVEAGLPDVIGAIEGCHVRITRPTACEEDYYNRKKFHSIILQAVCDADMVFPDVFVGFPDRAHEAKVLEESFLFEEAASRFDDSDIANSDLGIFSSEPVDVDHKSTLAARLRDHLPQSVSL